MEAPIGNTTYTIESFFYFAKPGNWCLAVGCKKQILAVGSRQVLKYFQCLVCEMDLMRSSILGSAGWQVKRTICNRNLIPARLRNFSETRAGQKKQLEDWSPRIPDLVARDPYRFNFTKSWNAISNFFIRRWFNCFCWWLLKNISFSTPREKPFDEGQYTVGSNRTSVLDNLVDQVVNIAFSYGP